jgi:hypothetical protein
MIDNTSDPFGSGLLKRLTPLVGADHTVGSGEPVEDPTPFAQNPANTRNGEKANSSFDRRHRLAITFVWTLPDRLNKAKILLANWEVSGIFAAQSGQPFSPLNFSPGSPCNPATAPLGSQRPNIGNPSATTDTVALLNNTGCFDPNSTVPGVAEFAKMNQLVPGAGPYITPSGQSVDPATVRFVQAPRTGFGNAGRNILTGPATANLDMSLSKRIPIGDRFELQLRAEVFNFLNRKNSGPFAGNPFIATDQQVSSTIFGPHPTPASRSGLTPENAIDARLGFASGASFLTQKYLMTSSRRVQFALKLLF